MIAIDANVILRYLVPEDTKLFEKASDILDRVSDGLLKVFCDPVILGEVVWVLESYYGRTRSQTYTGLEPILKSDGMVIPDKSRYIHALEIYRGTKAHFGDACACAAALEDCEGRLLSFDRKLSAVKGIERTESVQG